MALTAAPLVAARSAPLWLLGITITLASVNGGALVGFGLV